MAYPIGYRIIQDEHDRYYLQREVIIPVFSEIMLLFLGVDFWQDFIPQGYRYRQEFETKEEVAEYLIREILRHVHSARERRDRPAPRQRIISTHTIKTGDLLNMPDEKIAELYRTAILGENHGV